MKASVISYYIYTFLYNITSHEELNLIDLLILKQMIWYEKKPQGIITS